MMRIKLLSYLVITILLFAGCNASNNDPWIIEAEYNKGDNIQIYKLDADEFYVSIHNSSTNPKKISEWAEEFPEAAFVTNGAYFNVDLTPSGYLKINNERIGELLFDQSKTGLIQIEKDTFEIRDLSTNPLQTGEEVEYGLQSYPYLIKNSEKGIKEDSGKVARRTAIGKDVEGNIYIIFVDNFHISLYELMIELTESDIEFRDVLNLDGGPSSGLFINYKDYQETFDSLSKVPSVVVFSPK